MRLSEKVEAARLHDAGVEDVDVTARTQMRHQLLMLRPDIRRAVLDVMVNAV
jgi:hypothetical protein